MKTINLKNFSAYGGKKFKARKVEHFNHFRTEFGKLKSITIFIPGKEIHKLSNPNNYQHIAQINSDELKKEFISLKKYFIKNKINALILDRPKLKLQNYFFTRDLFWSGPSGLIVSRMGSEIRKNEETTFLKWAIKNNLNLHLKMQSPCLLEGADILWASSSTLLIGTNNRTNNETFELMKNLFPEINVINIKLPKQVQHLLGMVQIVDKNKVLLRHQIAPITLLRVLKKLKYQIIKVDESYEVTHLQAMNIVTIKPNTIIMPDDCPNSENIYLKNHIRVDAKFKIKELRKAGGGIACAIGILERES